MEHDMRILRSQLLINETNFGLMFRLVCSVSVCVFKAQE